MKQKTIYLSLILVISLSAVGQSLKHKDLHLYGSIGTKVLQTKDFFYSKNISPALTTIIGGGVFLQKSKLQYGTEFFYSNGTKSEDDFTSAYSGVNLNFLIGYRHNLSEKYKVSLQSGFGYTLNHVYLMNDSYKNIDHYNTAIFHNYDYTVPISVMLQRIASKGTFIGLKAGYNINIDGNTDWHYREANTTYHFKYGADGLYLQLILGGLLSID